MPQQGPTQPYMQQQGPTQPYMPQQGGMFMGGYPGQQNGQSQEAKILANFPAGSFFLPQQNVSCRVVWFCCLVYALCGYGLARKSVIERVVLATRV